MDVRTCPVTWSIRSACPQQPFTPIRLLDAHPTHRLGLIGPTEQSLTAPGHGSAPEDSYGGERELFTLDPGGVA